MTAAEAARIDDLAGRAGCTASEFMRAAALDRPPQSSGRGRAPVKDAQALGQILGQLGRIGNNVNQLARLANAGSWPEAGALEEGLADIRDMRRLVMRALGVHEPAADNAEP